MNGIVERGSNRVLLRTGSLGAVKTGETINDATVVEVTETIYTMPDAVIDSMNGTWQERTLAGDETFTFSIGEGQSVFVTVIVGANTLTLSNVTKWVGGALPSAIEPEHNFVFWSPDGVTVIGQSGGGVAVPE
ncbi:hypothetical protein N9937_00385 [bacterium]|nr:hypothetical protein [bacterium]